MTPKQKVLVYITRKKTWHVELLVFEHQDSPEAGIQVPVGTVKTNENLLEAVAREVKEECGVELKRRPRFIGSFHYIRPDTNEREVRNVFHYDLRETLPDSWDNRVTGTGDDKDMIFKFYWINLNQAPAVLAAKQGAYASAMGVAVMSL